MFNLKQQKIMLIGSIVFGVILFGIPALYAGDETVDTDDPEWVGSAPEEDNSDAAYEEGVVEDLGDLYEDLVFTPVTPCKIVDTRYGGGGFIAAGATRYYNVLNTSGQGGSYCSSPVGYPSAAHLAITVVNPDGKGNLKVFPYGASGTTGLQVNFAPIGTNLANAGTTRVAYGSGNDIGVRTQYAGCHVTIQVLGYYTRPEVTRLQVYTLRSSMSVTANTLFYAQSPVCATDYYATGGGCTWGSNRYELGLSSRPYGAPSSLPPTRWECFGYSSVSQSVYPHVVCARIPGR